MQPHVPSLEAARIGLIEPVAKPVHSYDRGLVALRFSKQLRT
jgi:hypothetical protein